MKKCDNVMCQSYNYFENNHCELAKDPNDCITYKTYKERYMNNEPSSSSPSNIQRRFEIDSKIFEKMLHEHCNIEYAKKSGEEIVNSNLSAVLTAFDEYLKQIKAD
jgi:hypothetical protein